MPTTYLGLPLGNTHKDLKIWDNIVEKTEKRLARWKAQYISFGGRHIRINSVLDSLPTYGRSLYTIPAEVVKKLDKLGGISFGMVAKSTKDTWSSGRQFCIEKIKVAWALEI